jgi:hypothetical protein
MVRAGVWVERNVLMATHPPTHTAGERNVVLCFDGSALDRDLCNGPLIGHQGATVTILDTEPADADEDMYLCCELKLSNKKKGEGSWRDQELPRDHITEETGAFIPSRGKKMVTLGEIEQHRGTVLVWREYLWRKPQSKEKKKLEPSMVLRRLRVAAKAARDAAKAAREAGKAAKGSKKKKN